MLNNENVTSSNQIKRGAVIAYFAIAFNILAGLIYTPWMVRQIGQADYGLFTLAVSFISFFALDFGLGAAVARFLSRYQATGDTEGAKKLLGIIYKLFLIISAALFAVLVVAFIFIENIYVKLTPEEISKLKVIFCISGMFSVISFPFKPLDGILIANERFIFSNFTTFFNKFLVVVLMVTALLLGYGLYAVVIVNAFVGLLTILIKFVYIKKTTDTEVDFSCNDKILLKDIFGFSFWTTVSLVAKRFILNITPTILGVFAGSVQIALFSVGMAIVGYTWTISYGLVGRLFLPKITRMTINNSDMREIENLMIKVGRIELLIGGLIVIGFASMGREFMRLWMGEDFINSYYVALLLIAPGVISFTQSIADTTLVALNKIKYRAIASLTVAGISIALSVILSRVYGAIGAAIAIFIGNIVGVVVILNIIYYKVLKINVFRFFKECHLKMFIPLFLTFAIGFLMQQFFPVDTLLLFMGKAGLLAVAYLVLMWIISLNIYEKELFCGFAKKAYTKLNRSI